MNRIILSLLMVPLVVQAGTGNPSPISATPRAPIRSRCLAVISVQVDFILFPLVRSHTI
jgi:hypothetical protein